MQKVEIKN